MRMPKKHISILTAITVAALSLVLPEHAAAQYFSLGDDPAGTEWMQMETPNYDVIYPAGMDSLAADYAYNLERYRPLSLWGISTKGRRMPVVLHPFNATANGMVMWAPKRMELLTTPDGYAPSAVPWSQHLAIHESRHIGHINNFSGSVFKPFTWLFGQQAGGLFFGLYQNTFMYEGDAVVTETVLSEGGRGRQASFLSYYMAAFADGDFRNRDRWIVGSYRHFTPDNYAYGYLLNSYIVYLTGDYGYYGKILETIRKRPYIPWVNNYAYRQVTGKTKRELHEEAFALYAKIWEEAAEKRMPAAEGRLLIERPKRYSEYVKLTPGDDGKMYFVRHTLHEPYTLVSLDEDGEIGKIIPFSHNTSGLASDQDGRMLYWTETVSDPRWSLRESSEIFSYDTEENRKTKLTKGGRFWNVAVHEDGEMLATTEYSWDGKYFLTIVDSRDGRILSRKALPERVRFTESIWHGDELYSLGITDGGMGIWTSSFADEDGGFSIFLPVEPVNISGIDIYEDYVTYLSDRDGVDNIYGTDIRTGETVQLFSSPFGIESYAMDDGEIIYCGLCSSGYLPFESALPEPYACPDSIYRDPVAGKIAATALAQIPDSLLNAVPDSSTFTRKKYRKAWHLFNIHSWSPFYFDTDNLRTLSFDAVRETASLGAAVWSQNHLGTAQSMLGYFYRDGRHGGIFKFAYTGLYPVIEAQVSFNSRAFTRNTVDFAKMTTETTMTQDSRKDMSWQGSLSAYIPFAFNYGGWSRGLIPQISWAIANDRYDITVPLPPYPLKGRTERYNFLSTFTASVRYYQMRQTPAGAVYPEYGFGAEAGYVGAGNMRRYIGDRIYVYAYGYLPAIANQGIRLSAMHVRDVQSRPLSLGGLSLAPRGLSGAARTLYNPSCGTLATAEYAIPVYLGDISIPGILYFKRAVATPFFDISFDHRPDSPAECYSAGADITFEVHIFNLPYSFSVGTRLAYNGGRALAPLAGAERFYAGLLFSASFE